MSGSRYVSKINLITEYPAKNIVVSMLLDFRTKFIFSVNSITENNINPSLKHSYIWLGCLGL